MPSNTAKPGFESSPGFHWFAHLLADDGLVDAADVTICWDEPRIDGVLGSTRIANVSVFFMPVDHMPDDHPGYDALFQIIEAPQHPGAAFGRTGGNTYRDWLSEEGAPAGLVGAPHRTPADLWRHFIETGFLDTEEAARAVMQFASIRECEWARAPGYLPPAARPWTAVQVAQREPDIDALLEMMDNLGIVTAGSLEGKEPPPRRWIVEGWAPEGHVTALYGDGGIGKTLLAQLLMTACATGGTWVGLPVARCRTFGLFCEDTADELHRRQAAINAATFRTFSELRDLRWISRTDDDATLMRFDRNGRGSETPFFREFATAVRAFGARLVVIDTAADTFGGDENDRSQVRQFITMLGRLAREIRGAVLLCAHPSREGLRTGRGDGGNTAWHNSVRSRWYLERPQEDADAGGSARVLSKKKANYAASGEQLRLLWRDGAFVPEADPLADVPDDPRPRDERAEAAFLRALDAATEQGRRASDSPQAGNYAPKLFSGMPGAAGIGKGDLKAAMERLFARGTIAIGDTGKRSDRHKARGIIRVVQP